MVLEDAPAGAAAAHTAGMRCVAVPYVRGTADDPAFATAGLLFPGGQSEFTARAAYDWLGQSPSPAPPAGRRTRRVRRG